MQTPVACTEALVPNSIHDHHHRSVCQNTDQSPALPWREPRMHVAQVTRFESHWSQLRLLPKVRRWMSQEEHVWLRFPRVTFLHARISITSICLAILPTPHYIAVLTRGVRARMSQSHPFVADLSDIPSLLDELLACCCEAEICRTNLGAAIIPVLCRYTWSIVVPRKMLAVLRSGHRCSPSGWSRLYPTDYSAMSVNRTARSCGISDPNEGNLLLASLRHSA